MEKRNKIAVFTLLLLLIGIFIFSLIEKHSQWIEVFYARGFYRFYSHVPRFIFGYVPFSLGDLFYAIVVGLLLYSIAKLIGNLWKGRWKNSFRPVLLIINLLLGLYFFFYLSWGLNYYREPISTNANLQVDSLKLADYLVVLNGFLDSTNNLREHVDPSQWEEHKEAIQTDLSTWVQQDTAFAEFLSRGHIRAKSPINSRIVSFFGVSGYFNPFTHEAQVNNAMPVTFLPFTTVHELAHQQGIGFEDEANFIAFVRLQQHPQSFYRYSAYLQTTLYMLRELQGMYPDLGKDYKGRLSAKVLKDVEKERYFWSQYTGWVDDVMGLFYNQYLKHNNQQEGIARYDRMTRLVLAYELKRRGCR
ncbi:DUF3810 domain-containing protein [Sphingobacterium siyangense]|uniref:DUF3810 domain-containing protein n=1 Tax=Sphingobacterium siyangense TaxID=459529 RepID=UPI0019664537|nr:DUF3810 domain-containing protein [Sphingobacterium siyangense]QRY60099.1 DUF3810 domain-containing protein [Sphingobacterium siyangense]